ncbi:MAG: DUF447 domain-containing protein [Methylococcaceae bacterium]
MIQELIVTTQNAAGMVHLAPMGVHVHGNEIHILPFRPSTTLTNLLETKIAVLNYCDDVRIFAGCLTGRRDFKLNGLILKNALAHSEVELVHVEDDDTRPKLICKILKTENHAPFLGFNRAQYSVLEAAILVSRLKMLPIEKIDSEIAYLKIGLEKTASERELEAWGWLMNEIELFKKENMK